MKPTRQLSAILLTDIVGYSAMMGRDEAWAMSLLERSRQIQRPLVERHQGQWIKDLGDGAILIFTSVLHALECALAIQETVREVEGLQLKIALHSGEIILRQGDVFGDGINVAARMEQLCQGNAILLSEKADREVRNIPSIETKPLGTFRFKNIDEPIGLFAVAHRDLSMPDLSDSPLRIDGPAEKAADASADARLEQRLRNLVRENLANPDLSVAFLARNIGYSRSQLYRKIQELTGQSPSDLIRSIRLQRAAEMLKQGAGNVSEVAFETGFNNLSHFSKAFRKQFGALPSDFARAVKAPPGIPASVNPFIGREQEIEEILELFPGVRMLTLTGTGGTGKTRLVLELLRDMAPAFPDCAWFVPLAPVSTSADVVPKIAQVLKIQQNPTQETLFSIAEFIGDQKALLVLDNFEHVLGAVDEVNTLLECCPGLKVLVTSRVVLNLPAEYEYPVNQLAFPGSETIPLEKVNSYPAVQLFRTRAQAVQPRFQLTEKNQEAVVSICRQLDGLPLALELAAARIKIFSPEALRKRLASSIDILSTSSSAQPDRHKTLRDAIGWSYNLLSPEQQTLFRRLSVFSGGCTLESAEQVCFQGYGDNLAFIDQMGSLVDKSLLQRQEQPDGEPRFFMLETVRAFGLERLQSSLEQEEITTRYVNYFIQNLKEVEPHISAPQSSRWLDLLELELDNIRAILTWAERGAHTEAGLKIATSFWRYWIIRSMMREGSQWLRRILDIPGTEAFPLLQCKALNAYALVVMLTTNCQDSIELFKESIRVARAADYPEGLAQALNYLGWTYQFATQVEEAEGLCDEALGLYQGLKDQRGIAVSYNNLGWIHFWKAQLEAATSYFSRSGQIRKSIGDRRGYAFARTNEVLVRIHQGQTQRNVNILDEAISILSELSDDQLMAWAFAIKAEHFLRQNAPEKAIKLAKQSKQIGKKTGSTTIFLWAQRIEERYRLNQSIETYDYENLQSLIEKCDQEVKAYLPHFLKIEALYLLRSGSYTEAFHKVTENLQQLIRQKTLFFLPEALDLAALSCQHLDRWELGLQLSAFCAQFREDGGMPVLPNWMKIHDEVKRGIEQHFHPDQISAISQRGCQVPLEDLPDLWAR